MTTHSIQFNCYCIFTRKCLTVDKDLARSKSEPLLCWQILVLLGITVAEMVELQQ